MTKSTDGFAVYPDSPRIVSPIDGTVTVVFPSGHAYGIENDKVEIIVHIGIDTIQLGGEGFHSFVKQGDTVKKGDCLWNIAKSVYGSGTWCYELARKNNIKNPDLIYPGQVLEI